MPVGIHGSTVTGRHQAGDERGGRRRLESSLVGPSWPNRLSLFFFF